MSSQSDYFIRVFDRNSYIKWQKPTDLDLHCLLRQGMSCSARETLKLNEFLILDLRLYCDTSSCSDCPLSLLASVLLTYNLTFDIAWVDHYCYFSFLTLCTLGNILSRRHIEMFWVSFIFPRKQVLTFHANCLHLRQFTKTVKTCFLEK